jgi:LAO/AO transport system kinase
MGLEDAWQDLSTLHQWRQKQGVLAQRRQAQALAWFEAEAKRGLIDALTSRPESSKIWRSALDQVATGTLRPDAAAQQLVNRILDRDS